MNRAELTLRAQAISAAVARRLPSPGARGLADPPRGSGLRPVPGDSGAPLLGHSLDILADVLSWSRSRHARYGEVSWFNGFGTTFVLALGPDATGEVLANRDKAFSNEQGWGYFIGPFFQRGVMLMDFEEHHHHRRIMQEAFTRDRLIGYLEAMNTRITGGLARWGSDPAFHAYPAIKQLTLDVATEVFLGTQLGPESDRLNRAFIDVVHGAMAMVRADVPGVTWHRALKSRRLLEAYFYEQLPAKRAAGADDLFSVLTRATTEDGARFADEDVVNHMIFVLMAAHDTSTLTATMMCYLLGRHPEWQDKLREESLALGKDVIEYGDLDRLTGLDLVMKETLRMYAPVGALARRALKDTELLGHYLPAGTRVTLALYPWHRMAPWWNDPDTFDPERFAEHRSEHKSHRYAFSAFGAGVHKCIGMFFGGMEVKAIMHQMLVRFTWSVPPDYHPPMGWATGPMPVDGLPIHLQKLEQR